MQVRDEIKELERRILALRAEEADITKQLDTHTDRINVVNTGEPFDGLIVSVFQSFYMYSLFIHVW